MSTEPLEQENPAQPGQSLRVTNREAYDPFAPLTPEQLAKLKEEPAPLREGLTIESIDNLGSGLDLDLDSLNRDYTYRWVHKSPKKVARARAKGYRLVDPQAEPAIRTVGGESPESTDGTYSVGDVVLMRVPKSTHKARRRALKKRGDQRLKGPERKFRRDAQVAGQARGLSEPIEVITTKGD